MKRLAIIGASGGIGGAFLDHYLDQSATEMIYACSRKPVSVDSSRVIHLPVDLTEEATLEAAAHTIEQPLDGVIIACGLLHDEQLGPEKNLQQLDMAHMQRVFAINSIGPALVMKYFTPLLDSRTRTVMAALSARVGSIQDNRLGGWYSYRASKAALNMLIKTAAIETRRRNREAIVVGLHPGTVDTSLSAPFQQRVTPGKLFSPGYAAAQMAGVLEQLTPAASGRCFAYDGSEVPA